MVRVRSGHSIDPANQRQIRISPRADSAVRLVPFQFSPSLLLTTHNHPTATPGAFLPSQFSPSLAVYCCSGNYHYQPSR